MHIKLYHTMINKNHLIKFANSNDDLFSTYMLNEWLLKHTKSKAPHVILRRSFISDLMEVVIAFSGEEVAQSVLHKWNFQEIRRFWLCLK